MDSKKRINRLLVDRGVEKEASLNCRPREDAKSRILQEYKKKKEESNRGFGRYNAKR